MNSLILRKLQLVGLLPDRVEHLERPKKLYLQLAVPLGFDKLAVQLDLLAEGVAPWLGFLIVCSLLEFLGVVEILATYNHQLSQFLF